MKICAECAECGSRRSGDCFDGGDICIFCERLSQKERDYRRRVREARQREIQEWRRQEEAKRAKWAAFGTDEPYWRDRESKLRSKYGLTIERFNDYVEHIAGKCECCGDPLICAPDRGYHNMEVHVDHIKGTKTVRGIVCRHCNTSLHPDDPERLIGRAVFVLNRQHGSPFLYPEKYEKSVIPDTLIANRV